LFHFLSNGGLGSEYCNVRFLQISVDEILFDALAKACCFDLDTLRVCYSVLYNGHYSVVIHSFHLSTLRNQTNVVSREPGHLESPLTGNKQIGIISYHAWLIMLKQHCRLEFVADRT